MKEKIEKLKERFINASDGEEITTIDKEMKALMDKDIDRFEQAFIESLKETNRKFSER